MRKILYFWIANTPAYFAAAKKKSFISQTPILSTCSVKNEGKCHNYFDQKDFSSLSKNH